MRGKDTCGLSIEVDLNGKASNQSTFLTGIAMA